MMTAQTAPWFEFRLDGRVPAWCFTPKPSVDGGLLSIARRGSPLVPPAQRRGYENFVRAVFIGSGRRLAQIVQRASHTNAATAQRAVAAARIPTQALPRDLNPDQWSALWAALRR